MRRYLKYLRPPNFASLTELLVRSVLASSDVIGDKTDADHGFGKVYKWRKIDEAFKEAKVTGKPILLLIHRDWCPACQGLKSKFSKSIRLVDLSTQFIMVNVENSTERLGRDEKFQPDGKYVPRILFYRPEGDLIREAYNRHPKNDPKYRYFYSNSSQVAETMLFVLEMIGRNALPKVLAPVKKKNDKSWVKPDDSSDNSIKPTILE